MKLVMQYVVGRDIWSSVETVPVEYVSKEQLQLDFEKAMRQGAVKFANHCFLPSDFFDDQGEYKPPGIMTLEQWWQKFC